MRRSFTPAQAQTDHPRRERRDDGDCLGWHWIPCSSAGHRYVCAPERLVEPKRKKKPREWWIEVGDGGQAEGTCTDFASESRFGLVPLLISVASVARREDNKKKGIRWSTHTWWEHQLPTPRFSFFHFMTSLFSFPWWCITLKHEWSVVVIGLATIYRAVTVYSVEWY